MNKCVTCHEVKGLDEFARMSASSDGKQLRCRQCFRDWYVSNAGKARRAIEARRALKRAELREQLVAYLGDHPCVDCGEGDLRVLDFDHRAGGTKRLGIAEMSSGSYNWAAIAAEIEKCDVRCANCHRRRTSERAGWWREAFAPTAYDATERLMRLFPATS